jgi:hypothetical protein
MPDRARLKCTVTPGLTRVKAPEPFLTSRRLAPFDETHRLFALINDEIVRSGAVVVDWSDENQTSLNVDLTGVISSAGSMIWSLVRWLHLVTELDQSTIIERMRTLVDGVDLDSGLPGYSN